MKHLTDKEILEACALAAKLSVTGTSEDGDLRLDSGHYWNPLKDDGDCARMENKCGVFIDFQLGLVGDNERTERFTPGDDAERRRASCLVVAMAQIEKETGK